MNSESATTLDLNSLMIALEPLLRKIVREELAELAKTQPRLFRLRPTMPLYQDMTDIKQRQQQGEIKLYSQAEVWDGLSSGL